MNSRNVYTVARGIGIAMGRGMVRGGVLAGALVASLSAGAAAPPTFPERPVRLVVPYAAGGPTDMLARGIGQELNKRWGQQVIVDLRPGGNSIIGSQIVANATPDGYTLLLALSAFVINPSVHKKLPYDSIRDFTPITQVATTPYLLLINPQVPARSVADLIKLARASPGKLSYGSGGVGTPAHLAMVQFNQQAKVDIVHVPYKGGAPALIDAVGGQIQMLLNQALSSMALMKAGKLNALAVTSLQRSKSLPDIPTVAESGLPSYESISWFGIFAPARTNPALVEEIAASVKWALAQPTLRARMADADAEPIGNSPKEFTALVASEIPRWAEIVRLAGAGKSID